MTTVGMAMDNVRGNFDEVAPIWVRNDVFKIEATFVTENEPIIKRLVTKETDNYYIVHAFFKFWDGYEYSWDFVSMSISRSSDRARGK